MKYCRFSVILCAAIVFGTGGIAAASEATTAPIVSASSALDNPPACAGPVSHSAFVRLPVCGTESAVVKTTPTRVRPTHVATHAYIARPMNIGSGTAAAMTGTSTGALRYWVRPSSSARMLSDIVAEAYPAPQRIDSLASDPKCSRDLTYPPTSRWSRTSRARARRAAPTTTRRATFVRSSYRPTSRVMLRAPKQGVKMRTVNASCDLTVPPTQKVSTSATATTVCDYPATSPCVYTWQCGRWVCRKCGRVWRPWRVRR